MAKPEFIAEVGKYEGAPESLEAVIRKLHPSAEVSQFNMGTRYFVREKQGLGHVMINVALFHKNGTGIGNDIIKTEPAVGNGSHSSYNVQISVSSPEVDCQQYIDGIVQEAGITLLPKLGRRSISLDESNGTGYAKTQ